MELDQSEFDEILNNDIRPFVSDIISNAPFHSNKQEYVKDSWIRLHEFLEKFNLPADTFKDLNVRYRKKIEGEILGLK